MRKTYIAGYDNEKKELKQLKAMLLHADEYQEKGVRIPHGLVLCGHPGVGKTVLAKSIADESIELVELRAADCCSEEAESQIHAVFNMAREKSPAILLLDELDKIAGTNDDYFMEINDNVKKVLLQEMDQLAEVQQVLVIATCNDTECLGAALLRPGRFDRIIEVPLPDEETRKQILAQYFGTLRMKIHADLDFLAKITERYTGARLECLVNEAAICALEKRRDTICLEDVQTVMDRMALCGARRKTAVDPEENRRTAIHEAGHAIAALFLMPQHVLGASILPQGNSQGHVQMADHHTENLREAEDEIVVLLAGRAAERLVDGEIYLGSASDLDQAGRKLADLTINHAAYGYRFLIYDLYPFVQRGDSDAGAEKTARFLEEKLTLFENRAAEIIQMNRDAFERITNALIEQKTLQRDELLALYERKKSAA